jgi:hypothetical protein
MRRLKGEGVLLTVTGQMKDCFKHIKLRSGPGFHQDIFPRALGPFAVPLFEAADWSGFHQQFFVRRLAA